MTVLELLNSNFINTMISVREKESDFTICAIHMNSSTELSIETVETDSIVNILQRKILFTVIEDNYIVVYVNRRKDKKFIIGEKTLV